MYIYGCIEYKLLHIGIILCTAGIHILKELDETHDITGEI